jgi:hypothetical protein
VTLTLVSATRTKHPHESRATACCKSVHAKRGVAWNEVFEVEMVPKCSMKRWTTGPSERFFRVISQIAQVCAFCIRIGACMTRMKQPVDSNFVLRGSDAALTLRSGNLDPLAPNSDSAG